MDLVLTSHTNKTNCEHQQDTEHGLSWPIVDAIYPIFFSISILIIVQTNFRCQPPTEMDHYQGNTIKFTSVMIFNYYKLLD